MKVLAKRRGSWSALCCVLIALLLRLWLVVRAGGVVNGDEALVGIQAQHILHGERPIYFYGQVYMGSLEAYLIAALCALFGSSTWTLRLEPLILSLCLVWLTCKLAALLAQEAGLSSQTTRWFIWMAGICAAIAPLYDTIQALRVLGGYIETYILMLLLLLTTLSLTCCQRQGASQRQLSWRWAALGLLVGLGIWINPLIIPALLTVIIWLATAWIARSGITLPRPVSPQYQSWLPALISLPAALIGSAPALYYGATHQWENFFYMLNRGAKSSLPVAINQIVPLYTTCVAPRIIGGALPRENGLLSLLHIFPLILGGSSLAVMILLSIVTCLPSISVHPVCYQIRHLVALPLLFALCSALFFCVSSGLFPCELDLTGRYATPLMLVLPFIIAAACIALSLSPMLLRRPGDLPSADKTAGSIFKMPALLFMRMPQAIVFAFFLLCLITQSLTYGLTDTAKSFQSPYCIAAPSNNDALIAYLQHEHIDRIWTNIWVAYPIIFKTDGAIIAADPRSVYEGDRLPDSVAALLEASQTSMIILVRATDLHPAYLALLDRQRIAYRTARFPSASDYDLLVITPLDQPFAPYSSLTSFDPFDCRER